jgi:hypothetical protein
MLAVKVDMVQTMLALVVTAVQVLLAAAAAVALDEMLLIIKPQVQVAMVVLAE